MKKVLAIQLLFNAAWFSTNLVIPRYVHNIGGSDLDVGLVIAAYSFASLLSSYVFGIAADRYGRKIILRIGLVMAVISAILQLFAKDPYSLLLARAAIGFSVGMLPPALVAYAYEIQHKKKVGGFLGYGSLGWGIGSIVAGFAATCISLTYPFIITAAMLAVCAILVFRLDFSHDHRVKVPFFPKALIKRNHRLYLSFFIRHSGANAVWVIFPLFLEDMGATFVMIGFVYLVNSIVQFFLMRRLDNIDPNKLIIAGLGFSVVTFISFALASEYWHILAMQVILALSWSFLYVGSVRKLLSENVERATANGMLAFTLGGSAIAGSLAGGILSEMFGHRFLIGVAAGMSLVSLIYYVIGLKLSNRPNTA